MPFDQAVLWIDHHHAQLLQFDETRVEHRQFHLPTFVTRQHGNALRCEHEFFNHVCEALAGIPKVLVAGPRQTQTGFRHYVDKHRPAIGLQIVGWETVDHPTQAQLLASARNFFGGTSAGRAAA